jgi:hypothetical protein
MVGELKEIEATDVLKGKGRSEVESKGRFETC